MNTDLSPEAVEYGRTARRALQDAGGDELAAAPAGLGGSAGQEGAHDAGDAAAKVLADLGAWDLDPRGSAEELEAAAALCHSAGWWAVPHPVAERVARPRDVEADALLVVDARTGDERTGDERTGDVPSGYVPSGDARTGAIAEAVADGGLRWVAVDLDGGRYTAIPRPAEGPVGKPGHARAVDLTPLAEADGAAAVGDVALGLVLPCWTLLGMLDRAVDLTAAYVNERQQFGQPLASFQGVQFQLTDAEVERVGVTELAKHALWSIASRQPGTVDDALALRLAAVEAAEVVFRITHQLHGAIGFCDETTLSWLSRASQPLRRLPLGPSATRAALTARLGRRSLTGIYS
ncbi:MAG TPA: acyl-CoA dehydrogenase family protein [Acidimicrobiales bacterium]|nr:acyl-CoA dehydrogenase family protein [Acidimicrobiales bacterium]